MLWYDGRLVEGPVPFDLADRGLLLGDGVFDTALALNGRIVFESEHVARLVAAAETLGFGVCSRNLLEAMRAVAGTAPRVAIRTTVTRGSGPRGVAPPVDPNPLIFASAAPSPEQFAFAPLRVQISTIARNETSPASRTKTLGYLDAVIAAQAARTAGFDDALFLNTRGRVACTGTGNVFAVIGGVVVTPDVSDGVLPGIMRGALLEQAGRHGLPIEVRSLAPEEFETASAAFVTNSVRLLGPISAIGQRDLQSDEDPLVIRCRDILAGAMGGE